ncbi:helix-turn-helix domain-containing protein [Haliangium sp.]|uniref:helix-turn-helix domain-containing protein n=1 Tax=Haliangium sp. TaxID=2663208 RepID=UPI003D0ED617
MTLPHFRHQLGLTQAEIAVRAHISIEFYSRIERGKAIPSLLTLVGLAETLGASPGALLDYRTIPQAPPTSSSKQQASAPRLITRLRSSRPSVRRLVYAVVKELERLEAAQRRATRRRRGDTEPST